MVLSGSQVSLQKLTLGSWAPPTPHPAAWALILPGSSSLISVPISWAVSDLLLRAVWEGALAPTPHPLALRVDLRWVRKMLPYRNGLTSAHWGPLITDTVGLRAQTWVRGRRTPGIRERTPTTSPPQTATAGVRSWGGSRKQGLQAPLCGDPGPSFSLTGGNGVALAMVPTTSGSARCSPAPGGCPQGPCPRWVPGDVAACRPGWAVTELLALDAWPRPAVVWARGQVSAGPARPPMHPGLMFSVRFSRAGGQERSVVTSQLLLG